MSLLLLLLLAAAPQDEPKPNAVESALLYLARHQNESGAWGATPRGCACPDGRVPELDAAGRARLVRWIEDLGNDDIETRIAAEDSLKGLGAAAVPGLRSAAERAESEVRERIGMVLDQVRLAPERRNIELTAMALLAFKGYGITVGSTDEREGIRFGEVVRKGMEWLADQQDSRGRFEDNRISAQALTSLVFTEFCFHPWEDVGSRASGWMSAREANSTEELAWKAIVIRSAECKNPTRDGFDRVKSIGINLSEGLDGWSICGSILLGWQFQSKDDRLCRSSVSYFSACTNRFLVAALDQEESSASRLMAKGRAGLKERALPGQQTGDFSCERGSWKGEGLRRRIAATAHHALALEAYYLPYDQ